MPQLYSSEENIPKSKLKTNQDQTLPLVASRIINFSRFTFDDRIFLKPHLNPKYLDGNLKNLTHSEQEKQIFIDICDCMAGIDGRFIYHLPFDEDSKELEFHIDPHLEISLFNYSKKILKFVSNVDRIKRFHDECAFALHNSQVVQHFTSCLRAILIDLSDFMSSARNNICDSQYSLHLLWLELHEHFSIITILYDIIKSLEVSECKTVGLIDSIVSQFISHIQDQKNIEKIHSLANDTINKYLKYVFLWMKSGDLNQSFDDFFISRSKYSMKNNFVENFTESHWNDYFEIHLNKVPKFFQNIYQTIFQCGKFSYTLKQALGPLFTEKELDSNFSLFDPFHLENQIISFHKIISQEFLNYMVNELDLWKHLKCFFIFFLLYVRCLRGIYLMENADFIENFLDFASDELQKEIDDIIIPRVESAFDFSLQHSVLKYNSLFQNYKIFFDTKLFCEVCTEVLTIGEDELSKALTTKSDPFNSFDPNIDNRVFLKDNITGVEGLCFEYLTKWPLSIIISQSILISFKMIFRFLLQWKVIESRLLKIFKSKYLNKDNHEFIFSVLKCVSNFTNYFHVDVIDAQCHIFIEKFTNFNSIDEARQNFHDFLSTIISYLFLDNKIILNKQFDLLKCIENIMDNINSKELIEQDKFSFASSLKNLFEAIKSMAPFDTSIFIVNRMEI